MPLEIKTIGSSGQLSLGKKYAGRTVVIDQREEGVWTIKTAQVIPDNERWLHRPEVAALIDQGLEWAATHPPEETDFAEFKKRVLETIPGKGTKRSEPRKTRP